MEYKIKRPRVQIQNVILLLLGLGLFSFTVYTQFKKFQTAGIEKVEPTTKAQK